MVDHSFGHVLGADLQNNPPLFYVLAWASAKLGDPDTSIRLPSLLLGTAAVPMTYALGLRTAGRWQACWALPSSRSARSPSTTGSKRAATRR